MNTAEIYINGEDAAMDDILNSVIELKKLEGDNTEEGRVRKMKIKYGIPTINQEDYINYPQAMYLFGLLNIYRNCAVEYMRLRLEMTHSVYGTDPLEEFKKIADRVKKFSGRKTDDFRLEVRSYAIKLKEELLQKGKSNRAANAIIIDRLERHPKYCEYVGTLGKGA